MSLLSARSLTHRFANGNIGVRDLSIDVKHDELLLIAGKNGSGKSVLMLHFVALLEPTAGEILLDGAPISSRVPELRRRVGIVFQNPQSQFLGQTVHEDVGFGLEYEGIDSGEIEQRIAGSLATMGISDLAERRPHYLSGGEQRKAALAAILARKPDVLILDEPFIGLDLGGVQSILNSILELKALGHGVVVITHDVEKVLAHADRMAIMDEGRVVADGEPSEIADELGANGIRTPRGSIERMSWLVS